MSYVETCVCSSLFTFISQVVCLLCSLQTPPVASLSLLCDILEASHDDAEFLIVMGGNLLISLLSEPVSVMFATAREKKRQACKAGRKAISKTDPNTHTKIQRD